MNPSLIVRLERVASALTILLDCKTTTMKVAVGHTARTQCPDCRNQTKKLMKEYLELASQIASPLKPRGIRKSKKIR